MLNLTKQQQEVTEQARNTYGFVNQILVSGEELAELIRVVLKAPRYDTAEEAKEALQKEITEEVADVIIVLDHIIKIFDLSENDIADCIQGKITRLSAWLRRSDKMSQTTKDRAWTRSKEVAKDSHCNGCYYDRWENSKRCIMCDHTNNTDLKIPDIQSVTCSDCKYLRTNNNICKYCEADRCYFNLTLDCSICKKDLGFDVENPCPESWGSSRFNCFVPQTVSEEK